MMVFCRSLAGQVGQVRGEALEGAFQHLPRHNRKHDLSCKVVLLKYELCDLSAVKAPRYEHNTECCIPHGHGAETADLRPARQGQG